MSLFGYSEWRCITLLSAFSVAGAWLDKEIFMKLNIGVFFGGQSVEHEVSIISAIQAIKNFDKDKYNIIPIYITRDAKFFTGDALLDLAIYSSLDNIIAKCRQIILITENNRTYLKKYPLGLFKSYINHIDVAFPIIHGTNVEDGCLQGYLRTLGIPFVGCDVLSSAVCMNKYVTKILLRNDGIPVLLSYQLSLSRYLRDKEAVIDEIIKEVPFPVIVKPVDLGSSIGIRKAHDFSEFHLALEYAFQYANTLIIERSVEKLKEVNCSAIGDVEDADASECEEPIMSGKILSYEDKYIGDSDNGAKVGMQGQKRHLPANISDDIRQTIRDLTIKAFKSLCCNGVVRIDFLIDLESNEIFINEVNTIPGSLAFYLWEPFGITYKELLDKLIQLALKKKKESERVAYSIETKILSSANLSGIKGGKGIKG